MSVATILAIVVVFFAATGAFFGMIRGFGRSFLRIITVFAAFLGSAYVCRVLVTKTDRIFHSGFVTKLLDRFGVTILERIEAALPEAYHVIIALPFAILAPVLFTVIFFMLSLALMMLYGIFAAFTFPRRRGVWSPMSNFFGAIVGVVQGAVIALAVMVPIVGLTSAAGEAIDVLSSEKGQTPQNAIVAKVCGYRSKLDEAEKSLVFAYAKRLGAERISNTLMTFSYRNEAGKTVTENVKKEIIVAAGIYAHARPLFVTDAKDFGDVQVLAVDKLAGDVEDSELLAQLVANLVSGACTEWKEGNAYLGREPMLQGEGEVENFLQTFYQAFEDSTSATIVSDFETIADIFELFVAHNVFASLDDTDILQILFTDPTLLEELFDILDANPRTHVLHIALVDLSIKAFCSEHMKVPTEGDEKYEQYQTMLGTVAGALNELDPVTDSEAMTEIITTEFNDALLEYGVTAEEISPTVINQAADLLVEEFGDKLGSVTTEDIENFIMGQKFEKTTIK